MGSHLLLNSWQLEADTVLQGGAALQEHPWENAHLARASIWRTDLHQQWLMQLPNAHRHYVEQFAYGSAGVKPRCLQALNLGPTRIAAASLSDGLGLWRTSPTGKLQGLDAQGKFRTAAAKEYPSALCRSLVVAMIRGLRF